MQRHVHAQFKFISGAKFDDSGEILIADARTRRLRVKVYTNNFLYLIVVFRSDGNFQA